MGRAILALALAAAATPSERVLAAWRRRDPVALARAGDAAPAGAIARMLDATRAGRIAALAVLPTRVDGLLFLGRAAALAAHADHDTARAAARAALLLLRASTRVDFDVLDQGPAVREEVGARLLAACGRRGAPVGARVDALFALAEVDRVFDDSLAVVCASLVADAPDATLRLAAVEAAEAAPPEAREATLRRALDGDRDDEVAAQAALALCRESGLGAGEPRARALARAPLRAPLAEDLRACLASRR